MKKNEKNQKVQSHRKVFTFMFIDVLKGFVILGKKKTFCFGAYYHTQIPFSQFTFYNQQSCPLVAK